MRFAKLQIIVVTVFFIITAHAADSWKSIFFTNQIAISNANITLLAVLSGDAQNKTNVQALIDSQVVFNGIAQYNANLVIESNILVEVELRPWRDVNLDAGPDIHGQTGAEVLGTLKSVDFEKRIIHIQARPENWKVTAVY